jgi:ABC-type Zn uptake system ZnuABC Zn-binding protein ZnuA
MKRFIVVLAVLLLLLPGCVPAENAEIAATTLPVYEFTVRLCDGAGLRVTRLVTESVSCLHDYTLQVSQMRAIEGAKTIVISGAGLEDFLHDALEGKTAPIEAAHDIELLCPTEEHHHEDGHHHHEGDPHIWLSPIRAKSMAQNIYDGLCKEFPEFTAIFTANLADLIADLDELQAYGESQLATLSTRELVTFHDGFSYLAQAFDLRKKGGSDWVGPVVLAVLTIVAGLFLIFFAFGEMKVAVMVIGGIIAYNGVSNLLIERRYRKAGQ